jgi:uncharacterized membrane-anchored protein
MSGGIDSRGGIDATQLAADVITRRAIAAPRGAGEFTVVGRGAGTLRYSRHRP